MFRYRQHLPQLRGEMLLTDGGLETDLIFNHGFELPEFAAFVLLETEAGREALRAYFRRYLEIAREAGLGFVLEAPTWRASRDWGRKIGYHPAAMASVNRCAIALMTELRAEYEHRLPHVVISGSIGPRGDGYDPSERMTADVAAGYHRSQLATFAAAGADLATAFTMPYADEALGIARAAAVERIPVAIGFTVETDGRLPSGESLDEAIALVENDSSTSPVYYMINCAHPEHFAQVLEASPWAERIMAVRANASCKSHAELDESTELDAGDPEDLAARYRELMRLLPNLRVIGGCCGTDHRHVGAMWRALKMAA